MAADLYAYCSCGSGKKFKWCCLPIYGDIQRALELEEAGQREPALRLMEDVVKKHPGNPEAWGRRAELLYRSERFEEAEQALAKAFEINPNYPYGLLIQAHFRLNEGEEKGALILARRAIEAYHPTALDALASAYAMIVNLEMGRNRPVAARAASSILIHCNPGSSELRDDVQALFGPESRLPEAARREYTLLSPPAGANPERRAAWDRVLGEATSPQLGALARAFEQLADQDASDVAAWYNRGVTLAWLGENTKAIEALDRFVELTQDADQAADAGALQEVLRCGAGLEDQADYREHRVRLQVRDFEGVIRTVEEWGKTGRLMPLKTPENSGVIATLVLEPVEDVGIVTSAAAAPPTAVKLAGYMTLAGNEVRLWAPVAEMVYKVRDELKQKVGLGVSDAEEGVSPVNWTDVVAEALLFPMGQDPERGLKQATDHAGRFFEHTWANRRLRSLGGLTPHEAAATFSGQKKLPGVVKFLEECAALGMVRYYDFNRLRTALGLPTVETTTVPAAPTAPALDVSALDAAGLAGLELAPLSDEQLEGVAQAAQKLGAAEPRDRAVRALLERTPAAGKADRFPLVANLMQQLLQEGRHDEALDFVNEGQRIDCEHNEGRRRNDYELRRGQVHVKRGEADSAHDVFTRLIERDPDNLKYRGSAIEGMLSLRQGSRAAQLAEEGLKVARRQNNRDAEQHFLELLSAARRLG